MLADFLGTNPQWLVPKSAVFRVIRFFPWDDAITGRNRGRGIQRERSE
jgi:hypothetical protein